MRAAAWLGRRRGGWSGRQPDVDVRPFQPHGKVGERAKRVRFDFGAGGAQLLRDLGFQLAHRLRVEAQHDALTPLDLQRRHDPARHVGPGKACLRR